MDEKLDTDVHEDERTKHGKIQWDGGHKSSEGMGLKIIQGSKKRGNDVEWNNLHMYGSITYRYNFQQHKVFFELSHSRIPEIQTCYRER